MKDFISERLVLVALGIIQHWNLSAFRIKWAPQLESVPNSQTQLIIVWVWINFTSIDLIEIPQHYTKVWYLICSEGWVAGARGVEQGRLAPNCHFSISSSANVFTDILGSYVTDRSSLHFQPLTSPAITFIIMHFVSIILMYWKRICILFCFQQKRSSWWENVFFAKLNSLTAQRSH